MKHKIKGGFSFECTGVCNGSCEHKDICLKCFPEKKFEQGTIITVNMSVREYNKVIRSTKNG